MNKKYFVSENAFGDAIHHKSESGKYVLVVQQFKTKEGCWNYSKGTLFHNDKQIAEFYRNYSYFPFLFIESHPNGHDYLICGEDYQSQTVLEIDTNKKIEARSRGAEKGNGFCWSSYKFDIKSQMLVVDGCIWAGPYEYRFFDFSDPMNGWPEIGGACFYSSDGTVEVNGDIVKYTTTLYDDNTGEQTDEIATIEVFRRNGLKFELQSEFISEKEIIRRKEVEESDKKYDAWLDDFVSHDPLYLMLDKHFPSKYAQIGLTYEKWCPFWYKNERRICRRVVQTSNITIDLEWAVETGPIKLIIYKNGCHSEDKFFEHNCSEMEKACLYAKKLKNDFYTWLISSMFRFARFICYRRY